MARLEMTASVTSDPAIKFNFPDPEELAPPIIQINDVKFGYFADRILFHQVNLSLDQSSKVALVGPNGIGKSTLLKLIFNELECNAGFIARNGKVRIGKFSQHHVDQLDMKLTPLESLLEMAPDGTKPQEIRQYLASYGCAGTMALQPISTL